MAFNAKDIQSNFRYAHVINNLQYTSTTLGIHSWVKSVIKGKGKKIKYHLIKIFEKCLPAEGSFFNTESNALLIDWNKFILVLGSVDEHKINLIYFF